MSHIFDFTYVGYAACAFPTCDDMNNQQSGDVGNWMTNSIKAEGMINDLISNLKKLETPFADPKYKWVKDWYERDIEGTVNNTDLKATYFAPKCILT